MSSQFVPKEQLSAYQRWEMNSFDVDLPTADEIEGIHRQARQEGYTAGYQEGKNIALTEVQRLQKLIAGLEQELQQFDDRIAQDLLTLALDVAKQVTGEALKVRPELILAVVKEALNLLPQANQHVSFILHPADAAMVRANMGEQLRHPGWKIVEDATIERGGCRVETANTQIDATLSSRWQRVVTALGQDHHWLDQPADNDARPALE